MTRISFHQKLENLRERLLQMAGVAEQTLGFALDAHCGGELSACANVRLNEAIINRSEREIDQMALDILAMEQPMAVDLRFVLAAIKINSDLERVGDMSMTIALLTGELAGWSGNQIPRRHSAHGGTVDGNGAQGSAGAHGA